MAWLPRPGSGGAKLRETLAIRQAELAAEHPLLARTHRLLGAALLELHELDGAEQHLLAAETALRSSGDAEALAELSEVRERLVERRSAAAR
jgi:hypothetical protein